MASRFLSPVFDTGPGIKPASGAKLSFFDTATSNPRDTFTTALGDIANTNPVIADSNGVFPDIFINGTYKVILTDKNDAQTGFGEKDPVRETVDSGFIDRLNPATITIASNDASLQLDDVLDVKEYSTGKGGGATWDVITEGTTAGVDLPNGADIVTSVVSGLAIRIRKTQRMEGAAIGAGGNTSGTPQTIQWQRLFALSQDALVTKIVLPPGDWYIDNSGGAIAVGGDCIYEHEGKLHFTNNDQRVFETTDQDNIEWQVKVFGLTEVTQGFLGGGYVRFNTCDELNIHKWEVSNHSWDGLKLFKCNDGNIYDGRAEYGKSSGITLEGCDNTDVFRNELNKNGLNSVDDSIADMPIDWNAAPNTGRTLIGRGITLVASSDGVPCSNCKINDNSAKLNTEYGMRSFGQSPLIGNVDCDFVDNDIENNGAPAGTFGGAVALPAKGVDLFINGSTVVDGDSLRLTAIHNKIKRSLGFGDTLSIAGTDCEAIDNRIILTGAAQHVVNSLQIFSTTRVVIRDNRTFGANRFLAHGSGNVDSDILDNRAYDCIRLMTQISGGTDNTIRGNKAFHRATVAVIGEEGINFAGTANIEDNLFDGFYQGVKTTSAVGKLRRNTTTNSVNTGFRNNDVNSPLLLLGPNDWDSQNPDEKANTISESTSPEAMGLGGSFTIPTQGFYRRGYFVFDTQHDAINNGRRLLGWRRLVEGTAHVLDTDWEEMWVETSPTS